MFYYRSKTDQLLTIRVGKLVFQAKGPKSKPFFSERYGYSKPFFRFRG